MTATRSVVLGCGSYLPRQILTNAELAARIDTSDEWIVQRTGIRQRHIAAKDEFTSHLASHAARAALANAGVDAQSIDCASIPASASAARAALIARCEVNSPSAAMWRCRMPVRCTIHSSEVSIRAASSALVRICRGK